jgi:hypothetical protein
MQTTKTYSIFGAGAAGLYTAWRLLNGKARSKAGIAKQLRSGDILELYDWGDYDFTGKNPSLREAGARVCTWHYKNRKGNAYLEVGGMRYARWDRQAKNANDGKAPGHRLVTTVISHLGLDEKVVPFNESTNPLFYLRGKNFYLGDINSNQPAPYNTGPGVAANQPDNVFGTVESLAVTATSGPQTRAQWNTFYQTGKITASLPESSVFQKGDLLKDIGYWNLLFDQVGGEGYAYSAAGNGYSSNVINWNSAVALQANNEFTPGTNYFTLTSGYSSIFSSMFQAIVKLAAERGVVFKYLPNTRLHSIVLQEGRIHYTLATRANPWAANAKGITDAAWLAMPRAAIELVAQASRYQAQPRTVDVLNQDKVKLYLESAIMQPSYKVGMFFDTPWWRAGTATYPAKVEGYVVTTAVIRTLHQEGFDPAILKAISTDDNVLGVAFSDAPSLTQAVEQSAQVRLTVPQEAALLKASTRDSIGPSITDLPVRMAVYFGDNATDPEPKSKPVYGMLASYDDEMFTSFWSVLELGPDKDQRRPRSENIQTLDGPRMVPPRMVKMLRRQLAELHFGPGADLNRVPMPLEARYMDWSLPPFNAGYHAWAAHFDIADVQTNIRKPSQLVAGVDADLFIVGEAYSNDQAWVEGAYCTAESVLNDFFDLEPLIDCRNYPFICKPTTKS